MSRSKSVYLVSMRYIFHFQPMFIVINHKTILTLLWMGEKKAPPNSFFPLTSANVGKSHQNFPTFSFNAFFTPA